MIRNCFACALLFWVLGSSCLAESPPPQETPDRARQRHDHVAKRRAGVHLICHRGALEFAHENTLEAYRAALELGADGNEIDIRATNDGVLVCFHDDMLDHLLKAYGDVSDYTWDELQKMPFRHPGRFEQHCRIPTLREVFQFHRDHHALVFLDVKRPHLAEAIGKLLDEYDLWDHIVQAPAEFTDPRIVRTRSKGEMYLARTEVDDQAITAMLALPGEQILLESPQKVAMAIGRKIGPISTTPVDDEIAVWARQPSSSPDGRSTEELLAILNDAKDWNQVASEGADAAASAERILKRAKTADELARRKTDTPDVLSSLEQRVRQRSLHRDWRYCGLDGCAALRAMFALKAPQSVELARFCLWRDDPDVEKAMNPMYKNPRSWTDFRTKIPVFKMLQSTPGPETEAICRDYLALTDDEARSIGVPLFEDAARCLLAVTSNRDSGFQEGTIKELQAHRLSVVRGRAILTTLMNRPNTQ